MAARVVVIGGGIAGLAAAYRLRTLRPDAEIVVVESSAGLGGKLRTRELAGAAVDVGAEAFVLRNPTATKLVDELGLTERLAHPVLSAATVRAAGRTVPLPKRTFLGLPAGADEVREVLSPSAAARVAAERDLPPLELDKDPTAPDVSVGQVIAERFGRELVDRLVEPLLGGVYAGRADMLGLRATMAPLVGTHETLTDAVGRVLGPPREGARPPVFGALRGGMDVLVGELAKRSAADVRLGLPVRALTRTGQHGWRLEIGSAAAPEFLDADAVILAVPAPAARKLLEDVAPVASAAYGRVEVASMAVVSLALPPDAVLPQATGVLLAVGERHADGTPFTAKAFTFSSRKWGRAGGEPVQLRASVGRYGEAGTLQRDDDELVAAVRSDLWELTGVDVAPVGRIVTRWGGGLPQYGVGHTAAVAAIIDAVAEIPGLAVAGAALRGVGIPATIDSATAAASAIGAYLASRSGEIGAPTGLVGD
ncbi:protoporphyrinogen oxidase [Kibdelosporangium phytohabitans]|uniref:Coproporphyrinogen III oxidase n=1 Tax=Kibdelosporangium phytohabitans TaxID=860235 RepID=A0A0N9I054_9PSEU|nr:protoporphyrinogen oxidase [Kibdelosporangium phytohabitans]ALG08019.1 protoporphyrinogen oxidase [Kibdelosporangium phytohabitans]MBE1471022.1 oxygen-dependent protoporphyrinogen oxidase [Kibdelosporangium phytohabitans]